MSWKAMLLLLLLLFLTQLLLQASGGASKGLDSSRNAQTSPQSSAEPPTSDPGTPLPAESPALQEAEVNADNGGTEFDADAADVQTPVGAQG